MTRKQLAALAVLAAAAGVAAAQVQTPAPVAKPERPATSQPAAQPATPAVAPLSMSDRTILINLARTNLAEIEAAKLAQLTSQNDEVKKLAEKMHAEHDKVLDDIMHLAQVRGVNLPTAPDRLQQAMARRMAARSGADFDRMYLSYFGVSQHKKSHAILQEAHMRAQDADLKALVGRIMPVMEEHLSAVEELHKHTARGGSKSEGETGASPDKK